MNLTQAGIDLIKKYEGCRLQAYPDPATGGDPWTIGYGCTGSDIRPGLVWTQDQANQELLKRLNILVSELNNLITDTLTDNQFNAVISLVYNIGIGAFEKSTLLKLINLGSYAKANAEFVKWDKARGTENRGLLARRQAEQRLFGGV